MRRASALSQLFTWRSAVAESELPATAKHVALTLSLFMSEAGDSAFPSLKTLARKCSRSKSTIVDALALLEQDGWLRKTSGGGRGHANRYGASIPQETVRSEDPSGEDETVAQSSPETTGAALSGDANRVRGITPPSTETVRPQDPSGEGKVTDPDAERVRSARVKGTAAVPESVSTTSRTTNESEQAHSRVGDPVADEREQRLEELQWALTAELGCKPVTRSEHGAWGKALAELVDAGATAEQLQEHCDAYRRRWPQMQLTPMALVRWWSMLGAATERNRPAGTNGRERWIEQSSHMFELEDAHWIVDEWKDLDDAKRAELHGRLDAHFAAMREAEVA